MATLLIADDHPLYRDALRGALSVSLQDLKLPKPKIFLHHQGA